MPKSPISYFEKKKNDLIKLAKRFKNNINSIIEAQYLNRATDPNLFNPEMYNNVDTPGAKVLDTQEGYIALMELYVQASGDSNTKIGYLKDELEKNINGFKQIDRYDRERIMTPQSSDNEYSNPYVQSFAKKRVQDLKQSGRIIIYYDTGEGSHATYNQYELDENGDYTCTHYNQGDGVDNANKQLPHGKQLLDLKKSQNAQGSTGVFYSAIQYTIPKEYIAEVIEKDIEQSAKSKFGFPDVDRTKMLGGNIVKFKKALNKKGQEQRAENCTLRSLQLLAEDTLGHETFNQLNQTINDIKPSTMLKMVGVSEEEALSKTGADIHEASAEHLGIAYIPATKKILLDSFTEKFVKEENEKLSKENKPMLDIGLTKELFMQTFDSAMKDIDAPPLNKNILEQLTPLLMETIDASKDKTLTINNKEKILDGWHKRILKEEVDPIAKAYVKTAQQKPYEVQEQPNLDATKKFRKPDEIVISTLDRVNKDPLKTVTVEDVLKPSIHQEIGTEILVNEKNKDAMYRKTAKEQKEILNENDVSNKYLSIVGKQHLNKQISNIKNNIPYEGAPLHDYTKEERENLKPTTIIPPSGSYAESEVKAAGMRKELEIIKQDAKKIRQDSKVATIELSNGKIIPLNQYQDIAMQLDAKEQYPNSKRSQDNYIFGQKFLLEYKKKNLLEMYPLHEYEEKVENEIKKFNPKNVKLQQNHLSQAFTDNKNLIQANKSRSSNKKNLTTQKSKIPKTLNNL